MRRCEYCKGILWPWQKRLGFSFHYDCRIYVEALWKQSQEQYEHDAEWHRHQAELRWQEEDRL